VQAGRFRQDLYYRLNVIRIVVPPLRERIDDMPAICAAVLERIAADAGVSPPPVLAADALQHLLRYAFPGNVRELENLLHRALALAGGHEIGRADLGLPEELRRDALGAEPEPVPPPAAVAPSRAGEPALPADLARHLDEVERDLLERTLERFRDDRTAAAASLGLSPRQLRYRLARLGVGGGEGAGVRGGPA